jgi:archaetidylinositol phosphate synthase
LRWKRELENKILKRLSNDLIDILSSTSVKPIHLTITSLLLALTSSFIYYFSRDSIYLYFVAGALFLLSGFLDALDGALARKKNMESKSGAFLDSTLDKIGESAIFIGIIASGAVTALWGSLALSSSILVSYTRSRAESLGVDLKGVGLMERAERMILISIASFIEPFFKGVINLAMILLTILSLSTLIHRILYVNGILSHKLS